MIRYRYKNARILFVGINPHPGSFSRSVPFSNNKMFWYLLSDAGLLKETRDELRDDDLLRRLYSEAFNPLYRLGICQHHRQTNPRYHRDQEEARRYRGVQKFPVSSKRKHPRSFVLSAKWRMRNILG